MAKSTPSSKNLPKNRRRLRTLERRYERLRAKLTDTGYVASGTITESLLPCGKKSCRCHEDPASRHGPYLYWSTKVQGKTVSKLLRPEEARLYRTWIENRRALERVIRDMREVSRDVAEILLTGEDPFIPGR